MSNTDARNVDVISRSPYAELNTCAQQADRSNSPTRLSRQPLPRFSGSHPRGAASILPTNQGPRSLLRRDIASCHRWICAQNRTPGFYIETQPQTPRPLSRPIFGGERERARERGAPPKPLSRSRGPDRQYPRVETPIASISSRPQWQRMSWRRKSRKAATPMRR